jgi:hypothetical protein
VAQPAVKKSAGSVSKEPQVSTSRAGASAKWAPRSAGAKREADVLDRLNRLAEPVPVVDPATEPAVLPSIVEADNELPPTARTLAPVALATTAVVDAPTELLTPPVIDAPPLPTDAVPTMLLAPSTEVVQFAPDDLLDESTGVVLPTRPLQRPVTFRRGKPRVRRVTRVVRHVDTWSVFKVAVVFNTILYTVCLVAGVLLWNVAHATGTVDNVEKFFEQFGWSSFQFKGGEIYHGAWIAGLFAAIGLTGFAVLLATLFNLITDLVGGVRVSVLEEEVVARVPGRSGFRARTRGRSREVPANDAPENDVPANDGDVSG